MGWWRRNPSLWYRSPLHRYVRRSLLDNEAALRSRCFSKAPPQPTQHKDDDEGGKRPPGISGLEWVQLQHYRRWKQRLNEDPYHVLFGASNDMLKGKGLKNWEWMYKVFPKWMVKDMDFPEWSGREKRTEAQNNGSLGKTAGNSPYPSPPSYTSMNAASDATYPRKVNIDSGDQSKSRNPSWKAREATFKTTRIDRSGESSGVASPSDPRRPQERSEPYRKDDAQNSEWVYGKTAGWRVGASTPKEATPLNDTSRVSKTATRPSSISENDTASREEASTREAAFIKEFLADSPGPPKTVLGLENKTKDWRETVLERRTSPGYAPKPRKAESASTDTPKHTQDDGISSQPPELKSLSTSEPPGHRFWPAMSNRGQSPTEDLSPIPSSQSPGNGSEMEAHRPILKAEVAFPEDPDRVIKVSHRHSETGEWTQTSIHVDDHDYSLPSVLQILNKKPISSVTPGMEKAMKELGKEEKPFNVDRPVDLKNLSEAARIEWATRRWNEKKVRELVGESESPSLKYAKLADGSFGPMQGGETQVPAEHQQTMKGDEGLAHHGKASHKGDAEETTSPAGSRCTSDVLSQLPQDDIDFLCASDIRASMGVKKSNKGTAHEQTTTRRKLEEEFKGTHKKESVINPLPEAKMLNDQYARRVERELKEKEKVVVPEPGTHPTTASTSEPVLEMSLDRMTKWLQAGGDVFTKHFWSDPIQATESDRNNRTTAPDPLLAAIGAGLQKGRNAIQGVKNELEVDLPCSIPLLKRLAANERDVFAILDHLFRHQLNSSARPSTILSSERLQARIQRLRQDLVMTENECEDALRILKTSKPPTMTSAAMTERLNSGAVLLQRNAKLTRRLILGLQERLESLREDPSEPLFWEIGHRLLALQDTQVSLANLVQHSLQVYCVGSKNTDEVAQVLAGGGGLTNSKDIWDISSTSRSSVLDATFKQMPEEEIQSQKAAMRGLSEDGSSRAPKPPRQTTFNQVSPLAHSTFRPFGSQLENLGREADAAAAEADSVGVEDTWAKKQQLLKDHVLVHKVRKSYGDMYGPIAVSHRQVTGAEGAPGGFTEGVEKWCQDQQKVNPDNASEPTTATSSDVTAQSTPAEETLSASLSQNPAAPSAALPPTHEPPHQDAISPAQAKASPLVVPETPLQRLPTSDSLDSAPAQDESTVHLSAAGDISPPPAYASEDLVMGCPLSNSETAAAAQKNSGPCTWKVLSYNATTDDVSVISTITTDHPVSTASISLPEALQRLEKPVKFLPHLPHGFDIVAMKSDLLVIRESHEPGTVIQDAKVVTEKEARDEEWCRINPVDGTTRLSPTGFVGVDDDLREEVRREIEEVRKKRDERRLREGKGELGRGKKDKGERRRKGGAVAGIVKTGIWAAAACYVAGVLGELFR
ncbi:uncharacterized protein BDR25DRAFT_343668 [Lindgomyces ingoldianus]|uniref:Uncharacterized protein n=1 Tax=Lindgomyces ingoldianus TaxID=673940 RepID=A0ACB6QRS9_9PLEO|nr:uncharacterized protein BDR25DRAFT_343668 [Lindgomyces ingoldianus]KAF2469704.1 hypothetical protein BDR25DRAFT_343668 [Lindgomyces ingoldianus]